ncbi:hypothetical protein LTR99_011181 [Exophiala xenobiotica]|uniref:Protein kinase domain-containing protein n=1 Tax=Vermiconidia calcicola TaxID=1690605 RepID=A0AAV9PSU8_9PEZI|nr:hypothetical protein LTR99_011181 [Exophiala xenobiotica]KAK5425368.1 hypothetical protein LTR34_011181 [Exophiala xenobiotica]KAK5527470.1 hypothetical protein LTR25_011173 [Vermiconidia calcicola]KAK5527702.1 hypothetical protein LTR23_011219 [Chaetothyriales sp. CCFEE 6169]
MTSDIANYLYLDGTIVKEEIIGVGGAGIVVNQGGYAFKIPRISKLSEIDGVPVHDRILDHNEDNYNELAVAIMSFKHEKAIYKRLGDHPGIIRCYNVDSEEPSIQMPLMNGDLRQHLGEIRLKRSRQLFWLLQLARTMAFAHTKRVIICDFRLDNIVYDDDMNIRLIDFSESSLMHLEWDLKGCDKYGFSILTDIGQFGAVMFEIITGQHSSGGSDDLASTGNTSVNKRGMAGFYYREMLDQGICIGWGS